MTQDLEQIARPAWWLCKRSRDPRFTAGAAYEVYRYESGRAIIVTDAPRTSAALPVKGATFIPYDPWAKSRTLTGEQP